MEYNHFSQIELPSQAVTETNPAHHLDFWRYSSEQVVSFNRMQTDLIRSRCKDAQITHNFMGVSFDFDHFKVAEDLDLSTWDSYPLGFLQQTCCDDQRKSKYLRTGDPDFQAFHRDLYRSLNGRFAVMEQQPGAVNWAPYNPSPTQKTIKLWTREALFHGAEFVNFFRFRQAPFA